MHVWVLVALVHSEQHILSQRLPSEVAGQCPHSQWLLAFFCAEVGQRYLGNVEDGFLQEAPEITITLTATNHVTSSVLLLQW